MEQWKGSIFCFGYNFEKKVSQLRDLHPKRGFCAWCPIRGAWYSPNIGPGLTRMVFALLLSLMFHLLQKQTWFDFCNALFKYQDLLFLEGSLTCALNIDKSIFLNCGRSRLGYLHLPEVKLPRHLTTLGLSFDLVRIAYAIFRRGSNAHQIFRVPAYFS